MKLPIQPALFMLATVAFMAGCSQSNRALPAEPAGSDFDAALAKYEQTLAQLPDTKEAGDALDEITKAAIADGRISGKEPRLELMFLFQDHNLGLYLFEQACGDSDAAKLEQLIQRIESTAPGSAIDAAAFDRELQRLDSDSTLTACDEVLNAGPEAVSTRRGRVALYRRAMCRRRNGMPKLAALDCIRLYAVHPEAVKAMEIEPYINATLKEAGFLLEADVLANSLEPARAAAALQNKFAPVAGATDSAENSAAGATGVYVRLAPDVAAIEQQAKSAAGLMEAPLARAVHLARMARIALEALAPEEAAARLKLSIEAAGACVNGNLSEPDCSWLAEVLGASSGAWRTFAENGRELRPKVEAAYKRLETVSIALVRDLDRLCLQAWAKALPSGGDGAERMLAEVKRVVERCKRGEGEIAVLAYNTFLNRFDDSPQAPAVMAKLADYYQTRMNDAARAAEVYAGLIKNYPNNPDMEKAVMRRALALYESNEYRAALDTLNAFAENNPDSGNLSTARYMAALSEAALGLNEEAEAHMTQLVNEYGATPIAPRALYWLGMNQIMRQDYDKAGEMFRLLIERYPESSFVGRARQYIANIERTSKP